MVDGGSRAALCSHTARPATDVIIRSAASLVPSTALFVVYALHTVVLSTASCAADVVSLPRSPTASAHCRVRCALYGVFHEWRCVAAAAAAAAAGRAVAHRMDRDRGNGQFDVRARDGLRQPGVRHDGVQSHGCQGAGARAARSHAGGVPGGGRRCQRRAVLHRRAPCRRARGVLRGRHCSAPRGAGAAESGRTRHRHDHIRAIAGR